MDSKRIRIANARFSTVLMVLLGLWSCVSMAPVPESPQWSCDSQADRAVAEGQWEQALSRHQVFLAVNPDNCLAIYHLGYIRGRLGDRENEISTFNRAVACGYDHDDQLYFNLGMAYAELNQVESAIAAFEQAIALKPKNAENHFGLGLVAVSAGHLDLASQALTKAVELNPKHWDARIELVRLNLDQGRLDEARLQLEAVQNGDPENDALPTLWHIYNDRKITSFD